MFAGFSGILVTVIVFLIIGAFSYYTKKFPAYNLNPGGAPGAFEQLLTKYLRLAEFMIGLATGS